MENEKVTNPLDIILQLVSPEFFVLLLFLILTVKVVTLIDTKIDFSSIYLQIMFAFVLIIVGLLATSIVSGKGYDCPLFVYVTNAMSTVGLHVAWFTDRPFTYLIMNLISVVFHVPGRVAVPYAGLLFAVLYMISVGVFMYSLTENMVMATGAIMFAMSSNLMQQMALNFVGNLFGMSLVYFSMAVYLKSKRKYLWLGLLLVASYFSYRFSCAFIAMLLFACFFVEYLQGDKLKLKYVKWMVFAGLLLGVVAFFRVGYIAAFIKRWFSGISLLKYPFMEFLGYDWTRESIVFLCLALVGLAKTLSPENRLLSLWILAPSFLMFVFPTQASRLFYYYPLPILAVYGTKELVDRLPVKWTKFLVLIVLVWGLTYPTYHYYDKNKVTNIRYSERGPFKWDTVFVEEKQLIYVTENYDLQEIIAITDIDPSTPGLIKNHITHPHLRDGVHYRIIAELGTNVFVGKIADLLENGYYKYRNRETSEWWVGYPYYAPSSIELEGKILIVISNIYNLSEVEKEILTETEYEGVYEVKQLSSQEKNDWLNNWKEAEN